ncbi:hypothetical protein GCM10009111_10650 [Colwellia asteriadis]|uniref:NodB homology domain-containing protein n=1 Tax=Colwellia asteriadis TaxID=517723 RepID=A0ABP3WG63_9GAMM
MFNHRNNPRSQTTSFKGTALFTFALCFLLSACGGSSTSPETKKKEEAVAEVVVQPQSTWLVSEQEYKLVDINTPKLLSVQSYWPSNRDIPADFFKVLTVLIPPIDKLFSQQYFAFSDLNTQEPQFKSIIFKPLGLNNSLGLVEGEIDYQLGSDGLLHLSFLENSPFQTSDLLQPIVSLIYQSERAKYRQESQEGQRSFEYLVSHGLTLHFIQQALSDEANLPLTQFANEKVKQQVLAQVKASLDNNITLTHDFLAEHENAIGYYLVEQHLHNYIGSTAANSFSVPSELFIPWLNNDSPNNQKTTTFVRTGDVDDQIAVTELSRQGNLFIGSYFLEGYNHEKLIALTFDDGPSEYTQKILDVLNEAKIPASFFWQGKNLSPYQSLIKQTIKDGHTVANHSWNHTNGTTLSVDALWQQQVVKTNNEFQRLFNITPRFYRPPYGEITDEQVQSLTEHGMKVLLWSVDSRDWNSSINTVEYIESEIINNQHEEVITLMHDAGGNRQNTVDSLPAIIKHYQSQGYRFVNLETLLGISDKH